MRRAGVTGANSTSELGAGATTTPTTMLMYHVKHQTKAWSEYIHLYSVSLIIMFGLLYVLTFLLNNISLRHFLAPSGAQGVTLSVCPAQSVIKGTQLNLHQPNLRSFSGLYLRSLSGLSLVCLKSLPLSAFLAYFKGQTESKILRLVNIELTFSSIMFLTDHFYH